MINKKFKLVILTICLTILFMGCISNDIEKVSDTETIIKTTTTAITTPSTIKSKDIIKNDDNSVISKVKNSLRNSKERFRNILLDKEILTIDINALDNISNEQIQFGICMDTKSILKSIKDNKEYNQVKFNYYFPLTDKFGNDLDGIVYKLMFKKETIDKINFNNFLVKNIPSVCDDIFIHDVLK